MYWIITKYVLTATVVVIVSEVAKRSDKVGALIASLPLITILAIFWMYVEGQGKEKIANHAFYTFWYVIPTLPMFLILPWLLNRLSFWLTMSVCMLVTIMCFIAVTWLAKSIGVELL
ncbi:DUF3147 family protein [Vibrio maritimus]|uniref:DUF3147 family protein n=1 Tax=Vibrio maritimus TaxID=990268 RepID=UPI00373601E5